MVGKSRDIANFAITLSFRRPPNMVSIERFPSPKWVRENEFSSPSPNFHPSLHFPPVSQMRCVMVIRV